MYRLAAFDNWLLVNTSFTDSQVTNIAVLSVKTVIRA